MLAQNYTPVPAPAPLPVVSEDPPANAVPCFGIGCTFHGQCQHYADVEASVSMPIGTCGAGWPMFMVRKPAA